MLNIPVNGFLHQSNGLCNQIYLEGALDCAKIKSEDLSLMLWFYGAELLRFPIAPSKLILRLAGVAYYDQKSFAI